MSRTNLCFLTVLIGLIAMPGYTAALSPRSVYVSTTGSDRSPGTKESPYKTLKKGLENISAGDTLYLCAEACDGRGSGTFNESVHSQRQSVPNGTDWTPGSGAVVVRNFPGETVTLAGGVSLINAA